MKCVLCKSSKVNNLLYGNILTSKEYRFSVHTFCLYLSSNLSQRGTDNEGCLGFLEEDILEEAHRAKRLYCCYCHKPYASIGCCQKKCRRSFHLICGLKRGVQTQFGDTFDSFCHEHVCYELIPNFLSLINGEMCCICYESLSSKKITYTDAMAQYLFLRAPCCCNGWFHRLCLQKFAKTAGYFFKCPLCNDEATFRKELPLRGICIPDQDAAWELETNAYAELLERPNKCEAKICINAKGRGATGQVNNPLICCSSCGSVAQHKRCLLKANISSNNYQCDDCVAVEVATSSTDNQSEAEEEEDKETSEEESTLVKDDSGDVMTDTESSSSVQIVNNEIENVINHGLGTYCSKGIVKHNTIQSIEVLSSDSSDRTRCKVVEQHQERPSPHVSYTSSLNSSSSSGVDKTPNNNKQKMCSSRNSNASSKSNDDSEDISDGIQAINYSFRMRRGKRIVKHNRIQSDEELSSDTSGRSRSKVVEQLQETPSTHLLNAVSDNISGSVEQTPNKNKHRMCSSRNSNASSKSNDDSEDISDSIHAINHSFRMHRAKRIVKHNRIQSEEELSSDTSGRAKSIVVEQFQETPSPCISHTGSDDTTKSSSTLSFTRARKRARRLLSTNEKKCALTDNHSETSRETSPTSTTTETSSMPSTSHSSSSTKRSNAEAAKENMDNRTCPDISPVALRTRHRTYLNYHTIPHKRERVRLLRRSSCHSRTTQPEERESCSDKFEYSAHHRRKLFGENYSNEENIENIEVKRPSKRGRPMLRTSSSKSESLPSSSPSSSCSSNIRPHISHNKVLVKCLMTSSSEESNSIGKQPIATRSRYNEKFVSTCGANREMAYIRSKFYHRVRHKTR